jgi:uncharacterized sulfatase
MYEEIVHIPLIVKWPGQAPAGAVEHAPVSHIDITPSILDLFDVDVPPILHGRSLLGRLRGSSGEPDGRAFIEFNRFNERSDGMGGFCPVRAVVTDRYKLVLNLLYTEDPELATVRDELHGEIVTWMNEGRDPFRGPAWEVRHWHGRRPDRFGGIDRPKPADGYQRPVLVYGTGEPYES